MNKPWEPQRVIEKEQVRKLIRAQFPEIGADQITHFGEGWDNRVFRVDRKWIFRFPRRLLGADLLETELKTVAKLVNRLPLPISAPIFAGKPTKDYAWPFAGYAYLPGEPACRANLDSNTRRHLAAGLADFLAELHTTDIAVMDGTGIPGDRLGRLNLEKRVPLIREKLARLISLNIIPSADPWNFVLEDLPEEKRPRHLVHGDFYACHFLIENTRTLTGIIDWGDIHLGDPACDLMVYYSFLPTDARPVFEENYGPITDVAKKLARLRALDHTTNLLLYAFDIEDRALFRESRGALDRVAN